MFGWQAALVQTEGCLWNNCLACSNKSGPKVIFWKPQGFSQGRCLGSFSWIPRLKTSQINKHPQKDVGMQKCLEGTEVTTRTSNTDFIIGSKRTGLSSDSLGTHTQQVAFFPRFPQNNEFPAKALWFASPGLGETINELTEFLAYLTCTPYEETAQQNISSCWKTRIISIISCIYVLQESSSIQKNINKQTL